MISAALQAQVSAFQAGVQAARPLSQTPALQVAALIKQGYALLGAFDAAISAAGAAYEGDLPVTHPLELPAALINRSTTGDDIASLHDMRGFLGRAVFNLTQGSAG